MSNTGFSLPGDQEKFPPQQTSPTKVHSLPLNNNFHVIYNPVKTSYLPIAIARPYHF